MKISLQNISKAFLRFPALHEINLEIESGELLALLGPSGSGKTTLLRAIAGLETISPGGKIIFEGEDVTNKNPRERGVGFVFQQYALFRHMTVFDNIAFGLQIRPRATRPNRSTIKKKVEQLLELIQLQDLGQRLPAQLSGGQRQRVALARALAVEPRVLLLDEPFGALDAKVRKELRRWLRQLHTEINVTSIFVTHDQEEALELADRIVLMNGGKIEQVGTPEVMYDKPASAFTFDFFDHSNEFLTEIHQGAVHIGPLVIPVEEVISTSQVKVLVRPHEINLHSIRPETANLEVRVLHIQAIGSLIRCQVLWNRELLEIELKREQFHHIDLKLGQTAWLTFQQIHVFPKE